MEKIAVIVPVYNVEKYLDRCINSILLQTYDNFELILINDGSTDKSGSICDLYSKNNRRIHVIHQKNAGVSAARNVGMDYVCKFTKCTWICFVDSDDYINKNFLKILYEAGQNDKTKLIMCDYTTQKDEIDLLIQDTYSEVMAPEEVYITFPRVTNSVCAKLYKLDLIRKYKFPEGKIMEDAHIFYKVLFDILNVSISVIDKPLYFYTLNSNGIYNSKWKPERLESIIAMKNQVEFMKYNNYDRALNTASYVYMLTIFKELKWLKETNPKMKKYEKLLRKKLKKAIIDYKKITGKSLRDEIWYYDYAYPFLSILYWKIKSYFSKRN